MKSYRGSRGWTPLNLCTTCELLTSRPDRFNPGKEPRYLSNRRQNRPQLLLVGFEKRKIPFPLPRIEPLTVQLVSQPLFGLRYPRPSFIPCELIYWTLHNIPFLSPQQVTYSFKDLSAEILWCLNTNRCHPRPWLDALACNTEGLFYWFIFFFCE